MRGLRTKSPSAAFKQNRVNVPGMEQSIWNPLYDYQTLSAAATASQRFFVDPQSGNKTLADTNMELSGQIPKGQMFLVTGVQVEVLPGVAINGTNASAFYDDIYEATKDGVLIFKIGSKNFIEQGNLMKFPPVNRLFGESSTTVATDRYAYAQTGGREFQVHDLLLESNQNFSIELREINALPSGVAARIGVTLNGFQYRNAQ